MKNIFPFRQVSRKQLISKNSAKSRIARSRVLRCEMLESREMLSTTYYVDATNGNDSWDGLAGEYTSGTTGPWKTLEKVNSETQAPGDSVLFARGESWRGTLIPDSGTTGEGNRITYGSYGDEDLPKPVIEDSSEENSTSYWTDLGDNIWESPLQADVATVVGSELLPNPSFGSTTATDANWTFSYQNPAVASGGLETSSEQYDTSPACYKISLY